MKANRICKGYGTAKNGRNAMAVLHVVASEDDDVDAMSTSPAAAAAVNY